MNRPADVQDCGLHRAHKRVGRLTRRWTVGLAGVAALAGCSSPGALHAPTSASLPGAEQLQLIPAGDLSVVTRRRPPGGGSEVLCVSPSPDWATAFTSGRSASGSGGVTGGPTASVGLNLSDAQTVAQMAGRTAGVVALRDGLYQACQAYANGQIGRAAYALILSQYGNVLSQIVGTTTGAGAAPQQTQAQALLVACLNAYDPTLPAPPRPDVVLTPEVCRGVVQAVSLKIGDLLTDRGPTPPPAAPAAPAAGAKPAAH